MTLLAEVTVFSRDDTIPKSPVGIGFRKCTLLSVHISLDANLCKFSTVSADPPENSIPMVDFGLSAQSRQKIFVQKIH